MRTTSLAAALVAVIALPTALVSSTAATGEAAAEVTHRGSKQVLMVEHEVRGSCTVVPNLPRGPKHSHITVPQGQTLKWRYNVDKTWAAVAIPGGKQSHGFPWWGFTKRSCLGLSVRTNAYYDTYRGNKRISRHHSTYPAGKPVPTTILHGRAQRPSIKDRYAKFVRVYWCAGHGRLERGGHRCVGRQAAPARVVRMDHNATLRDQAKRFVIGNVFKGWTVRPTSAHKLGMTLVYVPHLKRWGWAQV